MSSDSFTLLRTSYSTLAQCLFLAFFGGGVSREKLIIWGMLHHPNGVKLFGYCSHDEHRLLVSEFMRRGSLDNRIKSRCPRHYTFGFYFSDFTDGSPFLLSWSLRMKIALEAAKELAFLHSARITVMHLNFKTSHILLDSVRSM